MTFQFSFAKCIRGLNLEFDKSMSKKPSFPHNVKLNFLISLTSWYSFFFFSQIKNQTSGHTETEELAGCFCIWRTAVFDFSIIITWEAPLHVGRMTFLWILGSKLKCEHTQISIFLLHCKKGDRQRNWRFAEWSRKLQRVSAVRRWAQCYCVLLQINIDNKYWCLCAWARAAAILCVITKLLLSPSPRADEIEMIMTDLERANQVGF